MLCLVAMVGWEKKKERRRKRKGKWKEKENVSLIYVWKQGGKEEKKKKSESLFGLVCKGKGDGKNNLCFLPLYPDVIFYVN